MVLREIIFRGKRTDDGEWMCGNLTVWSDGSTSIDKEPTEASPLYAVIPETVGQYTGLTDKNGKKIFEGDIVSCKMWCGDEDDDGRKNWYISFVDGSFVFDKKYYVHKKLSEHNINLYDIEVIGNIHDNKDLLEVK